MNLLGKQNQSQKQTTKPQHHRHKKQTEKLKTKQTKNQPTNFFFFRLDEMNEETEAIVLRLKYQ